MVKDDNNNYNEKDSKNDKGILGSFKVLFCVIFLGALAYLQIEFKILDFVVELFLF